MSGKPIDEAVRDVVWRLENEADQFIDEKGMIYLRYLRDLLTAAQQPDHLVDANKMVAQQPAAVAPRAWLCTFGEVSGVTDDPKWRDMCARLGQQITPLVPAVATAAQETTNG